MNPINRILGKDECSVCGNKTDSPTGLCSDKCKKYALNFEKKRIHNDLMKYKK